MTITRATAERIYDEVLVPICGADPHERDGFVAFMPHSECRSFRRTDGMVIGEVLNRSNGWWVHPVNCSIRQERIEQANAALARIRTESAAPTTSPVPAAPLYKLLEGVTNANEQFEIMADKFFRDTGMLAPGKDPGPAGNGPEGDEWETLEAAFESWKSMQQWKPPADPVMRTPSPAVQAELVYGRILGNLSGENFLETFGGTIRFGDTEFEPASESAGERGAAFNFGGLLARAMVKDAQLVSGSLQLLYDGQAYPESAGPLPAPVEPSAQIPGEREAADQLQLIEERLNGATPGTWLAIRGEVFVRGEETGSGAWEKLTVCRVDTSIPRCRVSEADQVSQWQKDVTFIVHAKSDMQKLLDIARHLSPEREATGKLRERVAELERSRETLVSNLEVADDAATKLWKAVEPEVFAAPNAERSLVYGESAGELPRLVEVVIERLEEAEQVNGLANLYLARVADLEAALKDSRVASPAPAVSEAELRETFTTLATPPATERTEG